MNEWDGAERRKMSSSDHDILIEIRTDLRHLVSWSKDHDTLDTARFLEHSKKIDFQQKIIYGCIGIILFIEFISKVIK